MFIVYLLYRLIRINVEGIEIRVCQTQKSLLELLFRIVVLFGWYHE